MAPFVYLCALGILQLASAVIPSEFAAEHAEARKKVHFPELGSGVYDQARLTRAWGSAAVSAASEQDHARKSAESAARLPYGEHLFSMLPLQKGSAMASRRMIAGLVMAHSSKKQLPRLLSWMTGWPGGAGQRDKKVTCETLRCVSECLRTVCVTLLTQVRSGNA